MILSEKKKYLLLFGLLLIIGLFMRFLFFPKDISFFLVTKTIFDKKVAVVASIIYIFSFEQTQYSIFLNHPSLAVLSIVIFYLGLCLLFFRKKKEGLLIALLGLGLSIQFEFVLLYLIPVFFTSLFLYRRDLPKFSPKHLIMAMFIFVLTLATFILAEIKFHLTVTSSIQSLAVNKLTFNNDHLMIFKNIILISTRLFHDNIFSFNGFVDIVFLFVTACFLYLLITKKNLKA